MFCYAEPPVVITSPQDENVTEGDTATILCRANGSPRPAIQWIFNGAPLSSSSTALVQGTKSVASGMLSLNRIKMDFFAIDKIDCVSLCIIFTPVYRVRILGLQVVLTVEDICV